MIAEPSLGHAPSPMPRVCNACDASSVQFLHPVYTIEQTLSKRRANVFKIHMLIARRLLDVCSTSAQCLLVFIQLARRAILISMLIRREGGL